jgi:hypothetical protein
MRTFQFWLLVLGSTLVSALMIKQIFLSRELNQAQRVLIDSQQLAASAPEYENAWQQLAKHIYLASRQDPTLAAVLKTAAVEVRTKPSDNSGAPSTTSTSAPATGPMPSVPAKAPGTP